MIEKTLETLKKSSMKFEVIFQNAEVLSIDIYTNIEMYPFISDILKQYGTKDAGLAGGGFEYYPLDNGMVLAMGWNSEGPNKFYLGKMGKAF